MLAIYLDFLCSFSTKILSPYDFWHWELTIRNKNLCIWNFRHSATWTDCDSTCDHRDRLSHTELLFLCLSVISSFQEKKLPKVILLHLKWHVIASFFFRSPHSVTCHQSPYKVTHLNTDFDFAHLTFNLLFYCFFLSSVCQLYTDYSWTIYYSVNGDLTHEIIIYLI